MGAASPFKSKDESDLWRLGEPAVSLPQVLETLFTTGINSGLEEMARLWKFYFLSALCFIIPSVSCPQRLGHHCPLGGGTVKEVVRGP